MLRRLGVAATAAAALLVSAGCEPPLPERDLGALVMRDSTYYEPETMQPYTGRVYRAFADDAEMREIVGRMLDGTWHGELTVYHPSGRIRYQGSFFGGDRCGAWTENQTDRDFETAYDAVVSDLAALSMYPPCPEEVP
jgi:hypothetical protein